MLYDVIVVGSGIAGLMSALHAKRAGLSVAVLTKTTPFRSSSAVASGGINAVFSAEDSIQSHIEDTLAGGDGLGNVVSVSQMCAEAPSVIEELLEMGVEFAFNEDGTPKQRPFGGASKIRTCYSADKTGAAITQKLFAACREEGVEIFANHMLLSIAKYKEQLSGVVVLKRSNSHVIAMACKSLILAGGGYAGIYRGHTTNALESSGDLLAIAHRAGLVLSNLEFMQFHPTTLSHGGTLISEAARGEGGYIVDENGERFVDELSTRDKLSRAILLHQKAGHKVYLDLRHLGAETIDAKLPSTKKSALSGAGVDITTELLEIAPAAHYSIGGIWTREDTSTSMPNIFACGECAANGVHGANRLGGNSLLEAAYFGKVAGQEAARNAKKREFAPIDYAYVEKEMRKVELIIGGESLFNINSMRKNLGEELFRDAGVFRSEESLSNALEYIHYLMQKQYGLHCVSKEYANNVELSAILEFKNALLVAEMAVMCALKRKESRGVHYREDHPQKDEQHFGRSSYVSPYGSDYFDVTFGEIHKGGFIYKLKKFFHFV